MAPCRTLGKAGWVPRVGGRRHPCPIPTHYQGNRSWECNFCRLLLTELKHRGNPTMCAFLQINAHSAFSVPLGASFPCYPELRILILLYCWFACAAAQHASRKRPPQGAGAARRCAQPRRHVHITAAQHSTPRKCLVYLVLYIYIYFRAERAPFLLPFLALYQSESALSLF